VFGGKVSRREAIGAIAAAGVAGGYALNRWGSMVRVPTFLKRIDKRKNIILIIADALRADVLGKVLNGSEVSPTLNRLAARAVYFTNAFSASSQTKFSVPSILTGLYPPGHGVEAYAHTMPACLALQEYLRGKGYKTWGVVSNLFVQGEHVSAGYGEVDFGFSRAFDQYVYICDPLRHTDELDPDIRFFCQYADGELINEHFFRMLRRHVPSGKRRRGDPPFFAYIHYMDSHQPWLRWAPHAGVKARFVKGAGDIERIHEADKSLMLRILRAKDQSALDDGANLEALRRVYYEGAATADKYIENLVARLGEFGILEDCVLIITSDHGDELYEHGCVGHAKNLYNPQLAVPLMFVGGPFPEGKTVEHRVSNAAIFPTVMDLMGDEHPVETCYSLLPLIEGSYARDVPVFATLFGEDTLITKDGEKVIVKANGNVLFNLGKDPAEAGPRNIEANHPAVVACAKIRSASEGLGVVRRFSSRRWQNPMYSVQEERAEGLYRSGEVPWGELERRISLGEFLKVEEVESLRNCDLNAAVTDSRRQEELRALGYLN
jgi:arylsulfatase A-like enzyme